MEEENVEVLEERKDVVQTPKKKSPIGLIILVIILMCGCLVGGYFINESDILNTKNEKEEKKETKKEEKEEVVTNYEVTDSKVANLIDNILHMGLSKGWCNVLEVYANDKKVVVDNISNLMAYHIAENSLLGGDYQNAKDSYTLDELNAEIKKYLGKDYDFDPNAIDYKGISCPQYSYDSATKTYKHQQTACGGTCGPTPSYIITKAVDTDGILELSVKVLFVSLDEGKDGVYSDYAKTNKVGTFEDDREPLYEKGSNYKFTFKLEDGNYVFVSSEPVK